MVRHARSDSLAGSQLPAARFPARPWEGVRLHVFDLDKMAEVLPARSCGKLHAHQPAQAVGGRRAESVAAAIKTGPTAWG